MVAAIFSLQGVGVVRGGRQILHDVDAEIAHFGCTALLGASGAGKSTLLRLLNRLAEPDQGTVALHGEPLPSYDVLALRRRVGFVQQQPVLLADLVLDDLRVGAPALTEEAAVELLARVGLRPDVVRQETAGLSGGEAQRICFARCLAVGPEVLLADEPTSALDPRAAREVEEVIHSLAHDGLSVVLVSHNLAQAQRVADAGLLLEHGTVATPERAAEYLEQTR